MKPGLRELYRAAALCRTVAALAADPERDANEFLTAMTAIGECATSAHDCIDYALRQLSSDRGIGFADPIRRELDELIGTKEGPHHETS